MGGTGAAQAPPPRLTRVGFAGKEPARWRGTEGTRKGPHIRPQPPLPLQASLRVCRDRGSWEVAWGPLRVSSSFAFPPSQHRVGESARTVPAALHDTVQEAPGWRKRPHPHHPPLPPLLSGGGLLGEAIWERA